MPLQLSDCFAVYKLRNLGLQQDGLESKICWLFSIQVYTLYFYVVATKAQLKGEVRISEKTLEGGEIIEAPKREL